MGHCGNPCWQIVLVLLPASISTKTTKMSIVGFIFDDYVGLTSIFFVLALSFQL